MYTLDEFQETVLELESEYRDRLPVAFYEDIARHWFQEIFPYKNQVYGVEGLQRLGPMHAVAEFAGCFYRWHRMVEMEHTMTDDDLLNALHDAFGYSVIMRTMAGAGLTWKTVDKTKGPMKDLQVLLEIYWDDQIPVDDAAVTIATRIAVNMYRRTPGV